MENEAESAAAALGEALVRQQVRDGVYVGPNTVSLLLDKLDRLRAENSILTLERDAWKDVAHQLPGSSSSYSQSGPEPQSSPSPHSGT